MKRLKSALRRIPGVSAIAQAVRNRQGRAPQPFRSSGQYWENRYRDRGDSGAGSYGRLAQFKAQVLNQFVQKNRVQSLIEFGCGDGAQLALADYPAYIGVDVSETVLARCREKFASDASKRFLTVEEARAAKPVCTAALSLDVIYHLVEDTVYEQYMRDLFAAARDWVIVYASNMDKPTADPTADPHVRHRMFTRWIAEKAPAWKLHEKIDQKYPYEEGQEAETSFADFYIFRKSAG